MFCFFFFFQIFFNFFLNFFFQVSGTFKMTPNERNKRDLDFEIEIEFNGELGKMKETNKYRMR